MKRIEFYKHNIGNKEIREMSKVLKSLFITTAKKTDEFEKLFAAYLNVKYAVGVTSCTDGLFLLLKALGIKENDEVITTPLTFVSTANCIMMCGAKPVFVDVDINTGNIDLNLIKEKLNEKTKAVLPVHLYGIMVDMKKASEICKQNNLHLIEDSAHCVEGLYDDIKPGQLSDGAAFSFYATKNITSGEGGAIVTNNSDIAKKIRIIRLHGLSKNAIDRYTSNFSLYDVEEFGYKANMYDIQAVLLINQLKRIEERWKKKNELNLYYRKKLADIEEITIPATPENVKHSLHIFTIRVNPEKRNDLIEKLQDNNIGVSINFIPVHFLKFYREKFGYKEGMFKHAEEIYKSTITLPFYSKLRKKEIDKIAAVIKDFFTKP